MSQLTNTLAANDRMVDGFMSDLTSVSSQLAADRGNLGKALAALARAVGTVRDFVHNNKNLVQKDVRELTRLLGVLARHKDDLNTLARIGALGLDNLTVGFDNKTNTQGSRLQTTPNGANLGNMLCDIVHNSGRFPGAADAQTCELLRTIVKPFSDQIGADPSQNHSQPAQLKLGGTAPVTSLEGLLGAMKEGNAS
jgi:phospholipid/cholesterol/gamma-HCH transport system substrate-binding protein